MPRDYKSVNRADFCVFSFLIYTESEHTITAPPDIVKKNLGKNNKGINTKAPKFGGFTNYDKDTKKHLVHAKNYTIFLFV